MPSMQKILHRHYEQYLRERAVSAPQRRAGWALAACRTARLGGHVQRCPQGHVEQVWYNSCRHRACPQCNGLKREQWLQRIQARLINTAHHHAIFTIDHDLIPLWLLNGATMMPALFAAVRDTLSELLEDPRYLGAKAGMMLALHTWGRSLSLHPHIHALVTDGGWDGSRWVKPRRSHFLPGRVVMQLFRGKFLAAIRALQEEGELRLPDAMSEERFRTLINRLGRKKWHVHFCARYEHGHGVSTYLARYVSGGALSNRQIVRATDSEVVFQYTPHAADGASHVSRLRLTPQDFIGRVLAHTPEPRRHTVRYYGLYAHGNRDALDQARAFMGQAPVTAPKLISWQSYLVRLRVKSDPTRCAQCGVPLIRGALIQAIGRAPP